ncbi:MAG: asparagine synthase (glutamine-hydrolyzing) [Spirochaetales bacterium]|nr:asparagine synthase (glutamine-hydrolyzing) [Spirochaetales bacterium]
MCGICGVVTENTELPDIGILLNMMSRLVHRGPDSSGYFRDHDAALGHTRLSIIDLQGGTQPLSNEDGSLWVIYNGEIFNYIELAAELKKLGHAFSTKSDTEVIVHAYEQWGTSCFSRFNGQWAISLWDRKKKTLILSRDRLGIRPLYYTKTGNKFLFSSEIKALAACPFVDLSFDPAGLNEVFTFWCPVAPRTVFNGVYELKPGHFAVLKNGSFTEKPYWQPDFAERDNEREGSEGEHIERLKDLLVKASRLRFTRSDVPVGAFISGGLDSSITASIITHFTGTPLHTFSIRFSDMALDEGPYQRELVKRLGTKHEDIVVSVDDIGRIFPDVILHTERPILRTAPAPLFLLSRLVKKAGYKVVVTGEGADEVFAGYDIFREAKVREFLARDPSSAKRRDILLKLYPWMSRSPQSIPAFAHRFYGKSLDLSDPGLSHRPRWDTTMMIKRLVTRDFLREMEKTDVAQELLGRLPRTHVKWDSLSRAQWLEMTTLLSGYILSSQGDSMLMAHSVEGRFPFLDSDVVDFADNLPARRKLLGLREKHILKKAFSDLVPDSILERPKQPYHSPDAASFFGGHRLEWFDDIVNPNAIKKAGIFSEDAVALLLDKCRNAKGVNMSNADNMRIVGIVSTMLIHHHFMKHGGEMFRKKKMPVLRKIVDMTCNK